MIKINDVDVPNELHEMTLGQYEWLTATLNNKHLDNIERWTKVFAFFGVDEEYISELRLEDFKQLIVKFNTVKTPPNVMINEFELFGYTYVSASEGTYKENVSDLREFEKAFKNEKYISNVMAIIFKRSDLSKKVLDDKAHIKHKAKLFREHLKADICIPFIVHIGEIFSNQYENTTPAVS